MLKSFYPLIFFFTVILFFVQCKETSNASKENTDIPISSRAKPIETVTATKEKADTIQLENPEKPEVVTTEIVQEKPLIAKKVATKTEEAKVRKKKPVPPKKKRAKMRFSKTSFDFGKIKEGDKVKHDFKFKNTGDSPLVIKNVDVSCGCTFPSYPFIPIKPGEEGVIGVTFNSEHKIGRQKPTVTVVTNARPRTQILYLEGFVE